MISSPENRGRSGMTVSTEAILGIIAEESGLDPAALRPDATFEQLDIGSLDVASTLFAIEDKLGVVIDPDKLDRNATISDFVGLVMRLA
ncbi:MAG: acyl carrier protein [Novosphingobium pentaromativorans]|uniref:Acyl carrier protein n=1 Tax=Novosphingobium pentaromativorans TaxID=205844 RepID=A0A2W5QG31_9SPHN|nr:MAG: acyl carrier protein [Novosphingobium pentaromativorans]